MAIFVKDYRYLCPVLMEKYFISFYVPCSLKKERKYQLSNVCHIFLCEQHYLRYCFVSFFPQVSEVPWYYQKSLTLEIADLTIVRPKKLIRAETQVSQKKTGGQRLRVLRDILLELLSCL